MPSLTKAEAERLHALIEAGRALWQSAQMIQATQGRSLLRTDLALRHFKTALDAAEDVNAKKLKGSSDVDAQ